MQFSAGVSVNEDAGTAAITVTRTGGADGEVRVTYLAENGTAVSGSDFEATKGVLTWANGDTAPKTFGVKIIDDTNLEKDETVNLRLANPTGGAQLGTLSSATLTIVDNDQPPTANAGPDQTVRDTGNDGKENVKLDGSGSSDPDGTIQTFEWTENEQVIAQGANPTVSLSVGEHNISLAVTDNDGLSDIDNVVITVISLVPPVANAGPDQNVSDSDNDGSEPVTLDGSGSSDPNGTIQSFEWIENDEVIATGATPVVDFAIGEHNVTLVVTGENGETDQDTVTVTVVGVNVPIADAGLDQTVRDAGNDEIENVTLDGSGSSDPDPEGTIQAFEWLENGQVIAQGANPTVSLSVGEHTITLRVTDNDELTDTDNVVITVVAAIPPVARAGEDQNVRDTDNDGSESVALDGSGSSDPDGTVQAYSWLEDGQVIAEGPTPTVTLSVGQHVVTLTVTDDDGQTDQDTVTVTVVGVNVPIADAGLDQTVRDAGNDGKENVTLDGSGSSDPDPEGTIQAFEWLENDQVIAQEANPTVSLAVGEHTITLRVTDNDGLTDTDNVVIAVVALSPPIAQAGEDQNVRDADNDGSETVTLDGSASSDPDGTIQSFEWMQNDQMIAQGANPTVILPVGEHTITLVVTDNDGQTDTDNVVITVVAVPPPIARAGEDQSVRDADNNGSEPVTLDGSGSSDPDGTIQAFSWSEDGQVIAEGPTPTVTLSVGQHIVTLTVTDNDGQTDQDTVTVTVNVSVPIANAGTDQTVEDTNFDGVESIVLDGTGSSDVDGSITSLEWLENAETIATGETPTVSLDVGRHEITLRVTDDEGFTNDDQVVITVTERVIPPGSSISTESPAVVQGDPGTELGPFNVQLVGPDNEPLAQVPVTWSVTPAESGSMRDEMTLTDDEGRAANFVLVADPAQFKVIASAPSVDPAQFDINGVIRPGLTEKQRGMAETLDSACADLDGTANRTEAQQRLLNTCNILPTDVEALAEALDQIAPDELSSQGTMAVEAADGQARLIGSRLSALRGGATGVSVSGLSLNLFGQQLPQVVLESALPRTGAGEDEYSDYVSPFGIFINGNLTMGNKDRSFNEPGFDFDARDITIGGDYRVEPELIFGAAIGYGANETEFENAGGNIDFDAITLSFYGTYYQSQAVYIDGIVSFGKNSYDTRRRISFTGDSEDAVGDTDGTEFTLSVGGGYDLTREALTFGPYGRLTYLKANIDGYQESPTALGLELSLDDQEITSLTTVIGGKAIYNMSTDWGVFSPQVNLEWEREFDNDSRRITGRFVNDPSGTRFGIPTNDPDRNVFNLGVGATAGFTGGKTAFIFVESLLGHEDLTQLSITGGFRFEF